MLRGENESESSTESMNGKETMAVVCVGWGLSFWAFSDNLLLLQPILNIKDTELPKNDLRRRSVKEYASTHDDRNN